MGNERELAIKIFQNILAPFATELPSLRELITASPFEFDSLVKERRWQIFTVEPAIQRICVYLADYRAELLAAPGDTEAADWVWALSASEIVTKIVCRLYPGATGIMKSKWQSEISMVEAALAAARGNRAELETAARETVKKIRALKPYELATDGDMTYYGYEKDEIDEIVAALAALVKAEEVE